MYRELTHEIVTISSTSFLCLQIPQVPPRLGPRRAEAAPPGFAQDYLIFSTQTDGLYCVFQIIWMGHELALGDCRDIPHFGS